MSKNVLAFDFGASSGRALLFSLNEGKIDYKEIHRFDNDPVMVGDSYHWDILRLFHEIKMGILKCKNSGNSFDAIGIDTWGVDYGFLDKNGHLLQNPYHYRDTRTDAINLTDEEKQKIFGTTGIQFAFFNTLFQYMCSAKDPVFEIAETALFIPDLFNYMLTGEKRTEYTIASTSQMLNAKARNFDNEMLESFGLKNKFADMVAPGTIVGYLSEQICSELGVKSVPVIAVAEHDTASAVVAAPLTNPTKNLYISCGTWLLLGAQLDEPIITEQSYNLNYTNEGGAFGTYRFLKNIIGLWIQQESKRALARKGTVLSYQQLEDEAINAEPFKCIINPNFESFSRPGDMIARIEKFAKDTNQRAPETHGELNRTIIESLALECAKAVNEISSVLPEKIETIHAVGGGTQSKLLCQFIANATKIPVIAGPVEATSIGNALMQFVALGELESLEDARKAVANSFDLVRYEPTDTEAWEKAQAKYIEICNQTE